MDDHRLQMIHSSVGSDHRTPPELFASLRRVFDFDVDLAATAESALVLVEDGANVSYLGPDHPDARYRDALQVDWHTIGKTGFLNPPYSLSKYSDGLAAGIDREDLQWLLIENWAQKAYEESLKGFTTIGVFPYACQTLWFRQYVMGHTIGKDDRGMHGWSGHAALDYWRIPHRVTFLTATGEYQANAAINHCIVHWGPNPGFVGPWVPSGRYWSYR